MSSERYTAVLRSLIGNLRSGTVMVNTKLLMAGRTDMYGFKLDGVPLLCRIRTIHLWDDHTSLFRVCNRSVTDTESFFDVFGI